MATDSSSRSGGAFSRKIFLKDFIKCFPCPAAVLSYLRRLDAQKINGFNNINRLSAVARGRKWGRFNQRRGQPGNQRREWQNGGCSENVLVCPAEGGLIDV
jgi:hypothetical protein